MTTRDEAVERKYWEFESSDASAAHALRRNFAAFLRSYGEPDSDFAAAELIFGELIANVVRHAPGPIAIRLEWTADFPVLRVHDEGAGFAWNSRLPADPLDEHRRGLFLIGKFAREIRVEAEANDGTCVSVVLPVCRRTEP